MDASADSTPLVLTALPPASAAQTDALRRLMARAAGGSAEAVAGLYDALAAELYGFALWRTGSAADAADAVQEVFARLAAGGEALARVREPRAYLLAMTRRAARAGTRRRIDGEPVDELLVAAEPDDPGRAVDARRVGRLLARLPAKQREVLYLRHYAGLSFAEIGRVAQVSLFTAASRYRLGLARLRRLAGVTP